ncbi:MAG: autotransporter outer membrane beta-barrel domain-containing protein, partial [Spirochaetales bacterium]|nr:autotransporter outer membrane beta-barrel domain-containing protein [Spirochaetales bacterium]
SGEFVNYGGRDIAVYIGPHAHVKEINILRGAEIRGDIISRWDPAGRTLPGGENGMTALTFGLNKNSDGTAAAGSDSIFSLVYRGNILGAQSLNVSLEGGTLNYGGTIEAQSFTTKTGTHLLTDFADGDPTRISAQSIDLASGSTISFSPAPFAYGRTLTAGANPALLLDAPSLTNNAALVQSAGDFSIGPWDYSYSGLSWNVDKSSLTINTTSQSFNHRRGGTDAAAAPLSLAMHNSVSSAAAKRLIRRFAGRHTEGSAAPSSASSTGGSLARRAVPAVTLLGNYGSGGGTFPFTPGFDTEARNEANGQPGYMALAGGGAEFGDTKTGVWFSPAYHYTKHRGSRDYTIRGFGMAAGMDHWLNEIVMLGLGFGSDLPRYSSDDAETTANSTSGFIYSGVRLPLALELGLSATYSSLRYEQTRSAPGRRLDSIFGADMFGAGTSLGLPFTLTRNLILRPALSYEFQYFRPDSHSESAGTYALHFEGNNSILNRLTIGADIAFTLDSGVWFTGRIFYSGLYGDRDGNVNVSFVQDSQHNTFNPPVDPLEMNSLGLAAGLGFPLIKTLEFSVDYNVLLGKESFSHRIMLGLQMRL